MRLRTTAAALIGALAIVLPAAGPSLANDHDDDDGRTLGVLHYRFVDDEGDVHRAQIRPADNDTCYRLTRTTADNPAFDVRNETESLAVLYSDRSCGGEAVRTLEPGERARNVAVASALFTPVDDGRERHWGRPGGGDGGGRPWREDNEGRFGRQDNGGDAGDEDFLDRAFRSFG